MTEDDVVKTWNVCMFVWEKRKVTQTETQKGSLSRVVGSHKPVLIVKFGFDRATTEESTIQGRHCPIGLCKNKWILNSHSYWRKLHSKINSSGCTKNVFCFRSPRWKKTGSVGRFKIFFGLKILVMASTQYPPDAEQQCNTPGISDYTFIVFKCRRQWVVDMHVWVCGLWSHAQDCNSKEQGN